MARITIRIPDSKHQRLKQLAERQGLSLNKLIEEWSNIALAQSDAEARFLARSAKGDAKQGLKILLKLDKAFEESDSR
ncbi:MAG: toxin-antitoxin system HicB family antitoxin [Verrucomicrobiota bacterium]